MEGNIPESSAVEVLSIQHLVRYSAFSVAAAYAFDTRTCLPTPTVDRPLELACSTVGSSGTLSSPSPKMSPRPEIAAKYIPRPPMCGKELRKAEFCLH